MTVTIGRRELLAALGGVAAWPLRRARSSRSRRWLGKNWTRTIWSSSAPQLRVRPASGAMTTSKCSLMAALCPHHEGARGTGGLAVDVDAGLWPP